MRATRWLRIRSSRPPTTGSVIVTLDVDVSQYLDTLSQAAVAVADMASDGRYRRQIAHERSLGKAYVGVQLDQLCRDLGFDPVETWRKPRDREQRGRRERAARLAAAHAGAAVSKPSDGSVA